ncbi:MAG: site-specific DNA-methyltransferase [Candidatus Omnitrophota bacterium]
MAITAKINIPRISIIQNGDIFQLGRHRLMCGDSSNLHEFNSLIGKRKIKLVFAGPPYFNQRKYSHWNTYESYLLSMNAVIENCVRFTSMPSIHAWQIGRGYSEHQDHASHMSVLLSKNGLNFQDSFAWIKPGANYSIKRSCHIRTNGIYYPAFQWETILVYRTSGNMPRMDLPEQDYMAKHHTDVWPIHWVTHQMKRWGRPSVCPEEIPRRCIYAYTSKKDWMLDPFGGYGTTMITAERYGRNCLLMEKNPEYCKIIINRWIKEFNKTVKCIKNIYY